MGRIKGMIMSEAHKKKISMALKGRVRSKEHCLNISKATKKVDRKGDKNPNWKGDNVSYIGMHCWLLKNYGNSEKCCLCECIGKKVNGQWNIAWALKKGFEYKRRRDHFFGLCDKCHTSYDRTDAWNKRISTTKSGLTKKVTREEWNNKKNNEIKKGFEND